MSSTPEGKVKLKVRELLARYNVYVFSPVQTGFGARTLDLICCHQGLFFAIECKAPGKKMTEQQCAIAERIERSLGTVFCISSTNQDTSEWDALRLWLSSVSDGMMPTGFGEPSLLRDGASSLITPDLNGACSDA